jgi:hypothetical protein
MKNTMQALLQLGFTQEEAQSQLKELNDLILVLVAKRIMDENPSVEVTDSNLMDIVETKYGEERYQKLFSEVASVRIKGYFDAVTKDLTPIKRDAFFVEVAKDFQQI